MADQNLENLDIKNTLDYILKASNALDEKQKATNERLANLENIMNQMYSTPFCYLQERNGNEMAKQRCRVLIATNDDGTPVHKTIQASNQDTLNDKIVKEYIKSGRVWEFLPKQVVPSITQEATKNLITLKAYTEKWLKLYHDTKNKPTTLKGYRSYLNRHIYPVFGDMLLGDITTDTIRQWQNTRVNMKTGEPLKKATLDKMLVFLEQILSDAVEDKLIKENPAESRRLENPSDEVSTREALALEQVKDILSNVSKLQVDGRRLMALLLLTGCRRGEVLGLRWEDIDIVNGLIHIRRNVTYANNQPFVSTPKTKKGWRDIPLDSQLISLLEPMQDTGYIIGGGDKAITNMVYRRLWSGIEKAIDLHSATAHVFRHSYLTILASTGVDIKTVQAIGGHADIKTTMNRYVHSVSQNIIDAGNRMNKLLTTQ